MLLVLLVVIIVQGNGQEGYLTANKTDKLSIGLGMGLDFGGYGGNLAFYPQKNIGIYIGVGYVKSYPGLNAGIKLRTTTLTKDLINPYITAMWGYNGVAVDEEEPERNMMSFGPTFGIGVEFRLKPEGAGYFSLGLLFPKRRASFERYTGNSATEILISLGYHLNIISR